MYYAFINKKTVFVTVALLLCGAAALIVLSLTGSAAVFYGSNLRKLPIYCVDTSEKKVAISFDCAWGTDYTDELLSVMAAENVKSTFFAVEFWTEKHPDYIKKIFDAGHEIGTHSATHPYMSKLDKSAIERELTTSSDAIEKITGKRPELFRPPYGDYDDLLIETAEEMGLYTIQWDVDSLDWKNLSAEQIRDRVVNKVKNGSIVLFHNQGLHTSAALPAIIKSLKASGYSFVTIGELIYRENYKITVDGRQTLNV